MSNNEGSGIYEVTQMLGNREMLKQDLSQAMENVTAIFQGKYVDKIRATVNDHQINAKKNPTKELQLIHALKPFMDETKQEKIDKVMEMLYMINAAKDMTGELTSISTPRYAEQDSGQYVGYTAASRATHADGIYEYDESCIQPNTTKHVGAILMMTLVMQSFGKK